MRNTEIGGLIGISQLKRLDENVQFRQKNFEYFLSALDPAIFKTDFKTLGGSNYSLLAVLREPNFELALKLEELMSEKNIEFRRGSACGGNHLRQPYFKKYGFDVAPEDYPNSEHAHFFGYYLGNFPGLRFEHIDWLARELNSVADH
jgi:CDP-6-deoxy-D-xylo-4-hexulose-3-dehydrase